MVNEKKRRAILEILEQNPGVPFTPNEIARIVKNQNTNLKLHHSEVLRILLEESLKNPQLLAYKKVGRINIFWLKGEKHGEQVN